MDIIVKSFPELSASQLYEILKARAQVFVVEQQIVYNDLDDIDFRSVHVALLDGETVIAYARAFEEPGGWHIGRVLTTVRGKGYGLEVMRETVNELWRKGADKIILDSQEYAIGFYRKIGFTECSGVFQLDGIPHKKMELRRG